MAMQRVGVEGLNTLAAAPGIVRILLVEDCKSDVHLVERMLAGGVSGHLYDIVDVPRLIDAFSRIENDAFDVVMLDLNLLDIDGLASVAALRAQAPALPIIVYSGMDDPKLKEKAFLCGAASYLVKGRESGHSLESIIDRVIHPR